jgi:hypothetical protein
MIPGLEEIDAVVADKINDAVFLGQSSGPDSWGKIFESFGFGDSSKRIPYYGFDQGENTEGNLAIGLDPIPKVLDEFRLEDCVTFFPNQLPPRDAACR